MNININFEVILNITKMECTARIRTTPSQSTLSTIIPEPPVLAFRRLKSLEDLLVRVYLSFHLGCCKICGIKRCRCASTYWIQMLTVTSLHKYFNGYRSEYECLPDLPLSRHLRSPGHTQLYLNRLTITIIDYNAAVTWEDILARNRIWIQN